MSAIPLERRQTLLSLNSVLEELGNCEKSYNCLRNQNLNRGFRLASLQLPALLRTFDFSRRRRNEMKNGTYEKYTQARACPSSCAWRRN
jgi:DNA-directed RNA polymerase alpha subunit